MAFKILVMSPLYNLGCTTVASLIAQSVTFNNMTSMLLSTRATTPVANYMGLSNIDDPTRAITQVVKLIQSNAISGDGILNYSHVVSKNFYYLNTSSSLLTDNDRIQVVEHVVDKITTDIVVIDNSDGIDTKFSKLLLEMADMIIIVAQPSMKSLLYYKSWYNLPAFKEVIDKVYLLINQYNEVVAASRQLSRIAGVPNNKFLKLHYNPWIAKCAMEGTLQTIIPCTKVGDPRACNITGDLNEYYSAISSRMLYSDLLKEE